MNLQIEDFANKIFDKLLEKIPANVRYGYWRGHVNYETLSTLVIDKPNFIIACFDVPELDEYDHTMQKNTRIEDCIRGLIDSNPLAKIIFMTYAENMSANLHHDRLHVVKFSSALCTEQTRVRNLIPETGKNFDSAKNFICYNRNPRQHRINLVSYLLGRGLEHHGTISFDKKHAWGDSWLDRVSWSLTVQQQQHVKPFLMQGYQKIKELDLSNTLADINHIYQQDINFTKNFDLHLRHQYRDHFVEIVSETLFTTPFFGASEKFRNSVYGCVFPIMIGGAGVVQHLRDMGFDMFDDVVDHSYDLVLDPLDRLCATIDLNQTLLVDNAKVKQLWIDNQQRFLHNLDFFQTKLYDVVEQRAYDDFNQITWNS